MIQQVVRVPVLGPGSFLLVALLRFVLIGKEILMMIRRPALLNVIPHTGKCIGRAESWRLGSLLEAF